MKLSQHQDRGAGIVRHHQLTIPLIAMIVGMAATHHQALSVVLPTASMRFVGGPIGVSLESATLMLLSGSVMSCKRSVLVK